MEENLELSKAQGIWLTNLLNFTPHWNESVGANGLSGCSSKYNGNSVNVHSQIEFWTCHKYPKENFQQKNKVTRVSKVIYVLLFLTNIIYAEFDSLRSLKKEVAKDD